MRLDIDDVGARLARVDKHLLATVGTRVGQHSLSEAVAMAKKAREKTPTYAITRKEIEDQRFAMATMLAIQFGFDPDLAAALLNALIGESCRVQASYMHQHCSDTELDETDPGELWSFYRKQLLQLTEMVAPVYDEKYDAAGFATAMHRHFEHREITAAIQQLPQQDSLLDLGCATGIEAAIWSSHFERVIGYDISPAMISKAQAKFSDQPHVTCAVHDLEDGLPHPDASVAMVIMNFGTASDIRNIQGLLAEIARVLQPGGRFFLSFYNRESLMTAMGFLPWPLSLAAYFDTERSCLEVRANNDHYFVYGKPYTVGEVSGLMEDAGLRISRITTHPTVAAIVPEDILTQEQFAGYDPENRHSKRWRLPIVKTTSSPAQTVLERLDLALSASELNLGAYITVSGEKPR